MQTHVIIETGVRIEGEYINLFAMYLAETSIKDGLQQVQQGRDIEHGKQEVMEINRQEETENFLLEMVDVRIEFQI